MVYRVGKVYKWSATWDWYVRIIYHRNSLLVMYMGEAPSNNPSGHEKGHLFLLEGNSFNKDITALDKPKKVITFTKVRGDWEKKCS